jgi:putative nucleotidyltransferase with HDIG domain
MSIHAIEEAERTRVAYVQRGQPMGFAVRRGELMVGGGFILAALALVLLGAAQESFSLSTAALYVLGIAVAGHVRFDVGAGFTVPTQVIFVPMLFAVPASAVPLLVALALALGMAPGIISGRVSPSWLLTVPANSSFALGPCLVLLLANDHSPDGRWGILLLALAAQFAFDFIANAVREGLSDGITIRSLAEEVRPIYAIDVTLSSLGLAMAFAASAAHSQWAVLLIAPLFGVLRLFSKERHDRLEQLVELNDAYQGTALLLGDVVEADDAYTGEHCRGVVRLALDVAAELDLDADTQRSVEFGALLHDIGKIAVPKEIINKPGKLDDREWAIIRTHTIEGQKMLEKIGGFMREIGNIVRASHERWDGTGYPDGLSGTAIPLEARIVSACDAFNAMRTTRSYRQAMPLPAAVAELEDCAGSHFDPRVIGALLKVVAAPVTSETSEPLRDSPGDPATLETGIEVSVGTLTGAPQAARAPRRAARRAPPRPALPARFSPPLSR